MTLRYLEDRGYALGMLRDQPSWQLPAGAVYDSLNMIYDQPGIARHRGGTTNLVSGAQTAFATSLGFTYARDGINTIEELYGVNGKTMNAYIIDKTSGAATQVVTGADTAIVGRPVRHFGFVTFPWASTTLVDLNATVMAGQTSTTTFTNTANANLVAGNPQITLTGADVTTNVKVGAIVNANDGTNLYVGRVVSVDTTKLFTVWPVPNTTITAPTTLLVTNPYAITNPTTHGTGGVCAASFQNRLLYGGTNDLHVTAPRTRNDRRVTYSVLPTENANTTANPLTGAGFVYPYYWPVLNYFDVPGADPIVAMEPVADNQLLILTTSRPILFSGNLTTQLSTTSPSVTWDISEVPGNGTCISDLGVQHTAKGVVWAGFGGIYAWNGREPIDLTDKKINTFWRAKVRGSSFALHGSAYVRGHYMVSYTSGGSTEALAVNLTTGAWTRFSGAGTDVFLGVSRPTDPSQVFAARWWNQTGAAPSFTNGQTVRLESMLDPYTTGATKTDSDGAAVPMSLTTRTIGLDYERQLMFQRGTIRAQVAATTATTTVTAQSTIDAADIDASRTRALGNLSNTSTLTVTNATNANPIVVTTSANHGLQDDDFVDIDGVLGNTYANGRYRIDVLSPTTFSLVGQIGNAAYSSGGKVKKLTETDYRMSDLNKGQGASLTIAGSPNNIEIHGATLAVFAAEPVMSA